MTQKEDVWRRNWLTCGGRWVKAQDRRTRSWSRRRVPTVPTSWTATPCSATWAPSTPPLKSPSTCLTRKHLVPLQSALHFYQTELVKYKKKNYQVDWSWMELNGVECRLLDTRMEWMKRPTEKQKITQIFRPSKQMNVWPAGTNNESLQQLH